MNEKVREKSFYENVWVLSAPNDSGTSIGAAFAVYKNHNKKSGQN
jgi:predicted NodU family carbamoyl transferase